jgi:hypothetical protein
MTEQFAIQVRQIDGEPMIDNNATALLLGVDAELISAHYRRSGNGVNTLRDAWVQSARRRAREAMAHTGSESMLDALRYWAQRAHAAELEVVNR